jgi:hypothetical protein
MTRYQTTRAIRSLATGGVNLGARQPVAPQAFTPAHWAALLAEGVVIDITPAPGQPPKKRQLSDMTLDELKALADALDVPYTWNMKADTLRERIRAAQGGDE